MLAIDTGVKNFQTHTHTYSHSHTLPHITYWRIDALKMPNEINIASNAAWQCKCICKINRCIYLGEGFIIVSMPVCVSVCVLLAVAMQKITLVLFLQFCLHARVCQCVCVSGALTPKTYLTMHMLYTIITSRLATFSIANNLMFLLYSISSNNNSTCIDFWRLN